MKKPVPAIVVVLSLLLAPSAGADPAAESQWNLALRQGDVAALVELLGSVEDPDAGSDSGRTALMLAAQRGEATLVAALIEAGADVNARNPNDGTPLMYAAAGGNPEAVRLIVAAGADLEARAALGWTPLLVAAAKGHTPVVTALLDAGADPNARDAYGWTPLMRALHGRYGDTARAILGAPRVDLDAQEESGNTALHLVAAEGDEEAIRMLLGRGAAAGLRNYLDMSPADVARSRGYQKAARILSEAAGP